MSKLDDYKTIADSYAIPETMQALVLSGTGFENMHLQEVPVPEPGPNQLLARVDAAGVCTSILKIIAQGKNHKNFNGWDPAVYPVILGDEGTVTLVAVGDNLKSMYTIGERYGIQPSVDHCPINYTERYIDNGKYMTRIAVGYTLPGQLAEYIIIQEEVLESGCLVPLPDNTMPYFAVSMAEPISCVVSAQTRNVHLYKDHPSEPRYAKLGIKQAGVCIIIGAGGMGMIHTELAMRFKPRIIIVTDILQERLDWVDSVLKPKAQNKGITLLTTTPDSLFDMLKRESNGKLADDIICAVGIKEVQQKAFDWLGKGGVINLFGGLKKGDSLLQIDNIKVHYDEIKVAGSSGGDAADYSETLQAIHNGDIDPGNYVAAVGSLDAARGVLEMIRDNEIQGKAILYPHISHVDLAMVNYWDKNNEEEFLETWIKK
jgi:L-iditol 2-dehydrogenase